MTPGDRRLTDLAEQLQGANGIVEAGIARIHLETDLTTPHRFTSNPARFRMHAAGLLRLAADLTEQAGILLDMATVMEEEPTAL